MVLVRRLASTSLTFALFVGVCLTSPIVVSRAQQSNQTALPRPDFRTSAAGVLLDIRVVDDSGQFVKGLSSGDFRVLEDGHEQQITAFEQVDLSAHANMAGRWIDPDVSSNQFPHERRLYIIVLDDTQGPSGDARGSESVRSAARVFVERYLTDSDLVALVSTSGRRDVTVPFTNSRQRLLEAINRYEQGFGQEVRTFSGPPLSGGRLVTDSRTTVTTSLQALATWLEGLTGRRKSIVLFSRLIDCGISALGPLRDQERFETRDVVRAAGRSSVAVYALAATPSGGSNLNTLRDDPEARERLAKTLGPQRFQAIVPFLENVTSSTPPPTADWGRPNSESCSQGLAAIARDTGGFRGPATSTAFERLVSENSSYYLLGYTSSNAGRDDDFRRIDVVTRPGLHVIARTGYSARSSNRTPSQSPSQMPAGLIDAIQSPVPISGIGLIVTAPVFMTGARGSLNVIVETDHSVQSFAEKQSLFPDDLVLYVVAADIDGKAKATETGTLEMRLSGNDLDVVNTHGARLVHELQLNPGRYYVRVAAYGRQSGRSGSVHREIDVPNLGKEKLVLSDIVLTSGDAGMTPTRGTSEPLLQKLGGPPIANRVFGPRDELTSYVEIYDTERSAGGQIKVIASVRSENGLATVVDERTFQRVRQRSPTQVYPVKTSISLGDLMPGRYVLVIEASTSRDARLIVSRQIPLIIE